MDFIRAVHASLAKLVFGLLVAFGGRAFGTFEGGKRRESYLVGECVGGRLNWICPRVRRAHVCWIHL